MNLACGNNIFWSHLEVDIKMNFGIILEKVNEKRACSTIDGINDKNI